MFLQSAFSDLLLLTLLFSFPATSLPTHHRLQEFWKVKVAYVDICFQTITSFLQIKKCMPCRKRSSDFNSTIPNTLHDWFRVLDDFKSIYLVAVWTTTNRGHRWNLSIWTNWRFLHLGFLLWTPLQFVGELVLAVLWRRVGLFWSARRRGLNDYLLHPRKQLRATEISPFDASFPSDVTIWAVAVTVTDHFLPYCIHNPCHERLFDLSPSNEHLRDIGSQLLFGEVSREFLPNALQYVSSVHWRRLCFGGVGKTHHARFLSWRNYCDWSLCFLCIVHCSGWVDTASSGCCRVAG